MTEHNISIERRGNYLLINGGQDAIYSPRGSTAASPDGYPLGAMRQLAIADFLEQEQGEDSVQGGWGS